MLRRLIALTLALGSLSGCYSQITAYDGKFTIGYAANPIGVENFAKPIAPNAKLDLVVFANGTTDKLTILEASSSKPGVLRVESVNGTTLTVKGVAPGATELTITARDESGKRIVDKMFFHVAKPATHKIEHSCTDTANATYVRGTDIIVHHDLATVDKRSVIGYDYVPVAIEPPGALEFVAQPQAGTFYRYRATKANPSVTVRSLVDGTKLSARIVEPGDITAAELLAPERLLVGDTTYAAARVALGETPVCSQNALTRARSLTPAICKVTARLDDSLDDTNREQLAEITALAFGVCQLEMTLPELAGGKGIVLRQSIKIGRVDYPGEGRRFRTPTAALWGFLALAQIVGIYAFIRRLRANKKLR